MTDPSIAPSRTPTYYADEQDEAMRERYRWGLALFVVLVIFLTLNFKLAIGSAAGIWDADAQFAPYQMLLGDYARNWSFMLWNPWTNAGSPDFVQPELGAFSPVSNLVGFFFGGSSASYRIYWLLIWGLGITGMFALLKHLGAERIGTSIGALGFGFSGFYIGHAEHISMIHSIAWLPFVIWRLDVGLLDRRWLPFVQAGAIWGLSALAGYHGLTVSTGLFAFFWAMGRCWWTLGGGKRECARMLAAMAILAGVGFVILSPTYVGFLVEAHGFTDRTHPLPRETAIGSNALSFGALTTFASPYLPNLWLYNRGQIWRESDISGLSVYLSAPLLALAVLALVVGRRDKWRWHLVALAAASLALAIGQNLPFRGWLYDIFPPTRYFRHAANIRAYALFCVTILGALGVQDLRTLVTESSLLRDRRLVADVWAGMAIVAGPAIVSMASRVDNLGDNFGWAMLHAGVAWAVVTVGALLLTRKPDVFKSKAFAVTLCFLTIADLACVQALSVSVMTSDPVTLNEWRELDNTRHVGSLDLTPNGLNRVQRAYPGDWVTNKNVVRKDPMFGGYVALYNRFHVQWNKEQALIPFATQSPSGTSRIWYSSTITRVPPTQEAFDAFKKTVKETGSFPFLVHSREAMLGESVEPLPDVEEWIKLAPVAWPLPARVEGYEPTRLQIRIDCPQKGWLCVTDRWARGWRATVNGNDVPVEGGNFIFRAIPVSEGTNTVIFTYHPFGFPELLLTSWGALALVAGFSIRDWKRRKRIVPRIPTTIRK